MIWKSMLVAWLAVGGLASAQGEPRLETGSWLGIAAAEAGDRVLDIVEAEAVDIPSAWAGNQNFTTGGFRASGAWEVVLGAWCHDGVSFVRATVYDRYGEEVGDVMVVGLEGVENIVFDTEPGTYFVEVWSPDMAEYIWELVVRPVAAD